MSRNFSANDAYTMSPCGIFLATLLLSGSTSANTTPTSPRENANLAAESPVNMSVYVNVKHQSYAEHHMTSSPKTYDLYSLTQDENLKILLKDLEEKPTKTAATTKKQISSRKLVTEISIYVTTLICMSGIVGNLLSLKVRK